MIVLRMAAKRVRFSGNERESRACEGTYFGFAFQRVRGLCVFYLVLFELYSQVNILTFHSNYDTYSRIFTKSDRPPISYKFDIDIPKEPPEPTNQKKSKSTVPDEKSMNRISAHNTHITHMTNLARDTPSFSTQTDFNSEDSVVTYEMEMELIEQRNWELDFDDDQLGFL